MSAPSSAGKICNAGIGFLSSPSARPEVTTSKVFAIGCHRKVVWVEADHVAAAQSVAVEVEALPPAGLEVSLVVGRRHQHDESIADGGQRDRPALELDLLKEIQLGMKLDLVEQHAVVARAGRHQARPMVEEGDPVDALLSGRGAIGLPQAPQAGGGFDRLAGVLIQPHAADHGQRKHDQYGNQHEDDATADRRRTTGLSVSAAES